jgi:hypothetical protein
LFSENKMLKFHITYKILKIFNTLILTHIPLYIQEVKKNTIIKGKMLYQFYFY